MYFTYVFTSHTLANDFSVLIDENIGASLIGIDTTGSHRGSHERLGLLEQVLCCETLGKHLSETIYNY